MLKMQIQYQIIILYGIHHIPLLEGNLLLPLYNRVVIGECCDRVWLHPEGVVSLLVGEEIGSFLRELDAVHVILRGLEGIL